ncbi:hypothetical protein TRFO_23732 [Tritrichomonas foetus]|uniref:Uncharacterized protein n=1 Tax=Tritrichomonas foetus TaxID=1144522 RepID=A0A1J4K8P8_9EUKA|nr:hypothetical protein TRFO_23732 [Tritrichomonas foetus]|eukprot:OHT07873.1 hypothetical protein TRFO_23732 [Tritrichomonas foetus]
MSGSEAENEKPTEESPLEKLTIQPILLATFVKEPSQLFRCRSEKIVDHTGAIFSIYTEDGITYICKGSPGRKKKEQFDRIITLPQKDNESQSNQNFHSEDIENQIEKLHRFTENLKKNTEEVNDIHITEFYLQWGISENEIPCLIGCRDSKYRYNSSNERFSAVNTQIVLFEALEISLIPTTGKCFTGGQRCLGSDMTMNRQKIETVRIRKFLDQIFECDDNSTQMFDVDDKKILEKYIMKRISLLCPPLMMSSVPVCRRCFALYSKEPKTSSRRVKISRASNNNNDNFSLKSQSSIRTQRIDGSFSQRPQTATTRNHHPLNMERVLPERIGTARLSTSRLKAIKPPKRSPSGLTYVQTYSIKNMNKAQKVYMSSPFPAFLQHS